jgi:hypothetical protein
VRALRKNYYDDLVLPRRFGRMKFPDLVSRGTGSGSLQFVKSQMQSAAGADSHPIGPQAPDLRKTA